MNGIADRLPPSAEPVLVLAPHPDDFECIAVTLNRLRGSGRTIELAVLTGAAGGVDDEDCSPPTPGRKAELREAEQREGCRLFGLPEERLRFLRLREDAEGHPFDNEANGASVRSIVREISPGIVCSPHPNDSNAGHRRTYRMFRRAVEATSCTVVALLNEDPKTRGMTTSAYMPFGEDLAEWKAALLRCHDSQQQRNLRSRGFGLDERILEVNRRAAERLGIGAPYAEAFEIRRWVDGRMISAAASGP